MCARTAEKLRKRLARKSADVEIGQCANPERRAFALQSVKNFCMTYGGHDQGVESSESQPTYQLCGNVPRGATVVVYHDGRKLGEIKAPSGRFELQAAMPRGLQSVRVVAIGEDGRSIGSDTHTFTVK
jgi:hypothetical protein